MCNVINKARAMAGKINPYYTMRLNNIEEIYKNSDDHIDMIYNSFCFGYMQGMKAAKAEMKKAVKQSIVLEKDMAAGVVK